MVRMGFRNEGIPAFNPRAETLLDEKFEGTINRRRRDSTAESPFELLDQVVSTNWPLSPQDHFEDISAKGGEPHPSLSAGLLHSAEPRGNIVY